MTKKIAVINDLSGFGRCSLTAAIPVISSMGIQPCPLPTAILSAQTGFASYFYDDYTEKMESFRHEWEKMDAHFDGIYTGFVAGNKQIEQIFRFIDTFYEEKTFLLVDPVMGDNGITHALFTEELRRQMCLLTKRADIITPNVTELCLLADASYEKLQQIKDEHLLMEAIDAIGKRLCAGTSQQIIVTGIHYEDAHGITQMGNLYITSKSYRLFAFPYIGGSYSGTGDLFASCLAGGIARGDSVPDTILLAGTFLEMALKDTASKQTHRNEGVNFEKYLYLL